MARTSVMCRSVWQVFVLVLVASQVQITSTEIHRAKHLKTKSGQWSKPPAPMSDFWGEGGVDSRGHTQETWLYSIGSAILVGLSGIVPLAVIPLEAGKALRQGAPAAHLRLLLSFGVGGLLGDVFLHLLPEAWKHVPPGSHEGHLSVGLWVLTGLLTFLCIEKAFPDGRNEEDEKEVKEENASVKDSKAIANGHTSATELDTQASKTRQRRKDKTEASNGHSPTQNGSSILNGSAMNGDAHANIKEVLARENHIKTSGWLNLMANVIDNFTHGLAVAGSYCISTRSGMITTAIILLHEVPHEIGDFAILLRSGFDRWKAAKAQILTASGGVLGAITALLAESAADAGDRTAWILPFTSGGFIYIALVTVIPDLLKETDPWNSFKQMVLLLLGIGIMASIAAFLE